MREFRWFVHVVWWLRPSLNTDDVSDRVFIVFIILFVWYSLRLMGFKLSHTICISHWFIKELVIQIAWRYWVVVSTSRSATMIFTWLWFCIFEFWKVTVVDGVTTRLFVVLTQVVYSWFRNKKIRYIDKTTTTTFMNIMNKTLWSCHFNCLSVWTECLTCTRITTFLQISLLWSLTSILNLRSSFWVGC